jgi:hypothetical protein
MSRTFYPSDEYDSFELELERAKRRQAWPRKFRRDDDDDDPPDAPVAARPPRTPPIGAAQAA